MSSAILCQALPHSIRTLEQVSYECPYFGRRLEHQLRAYRQAPDEVFAFAFDTAFLTGMRVQQYGASALIVSLPAAVAPQLTGLLSNPPSLQSVHNIEQRTTQVVMRWTVPGQMSLGVSLCDAVRVLYRGLSPDHFPRAFPKLKTPPSEQMAVVLIAGDCVAVGGVRMEKAWESALEAAFLSHFQDEAPMLTPDRTTLERASKKASKHGSTPFVGKFWCDAAEDAHSDHRHPLALAPVVHDVPADVRYGD